MAEALAYLLTLALFSFVIVASARMRHDMLLLACIPPVFVASIVGFVMALYAGDTFGAAADRRRPGARAAAGWWLAQRFKPRDLLIAIYLAWAVALVRGADRLRLPRPDRDARQDYISTTTYCSSTVTGMVSAT